MINVQNLTKYYGTNAALKDVTFSVDNGEVVGLLGPNGAGKTTTLNIITGVLFPNEGQVVINGLKMSVHERELKQQIGYLSEDNPLYTSMLVSESLQLAGDLKNMSSIDYYQNLEKVVDVTGLSKVFYKPIDTLSKGYRQRVGLAQALINNPPILILDEPTEGLDPNQRQEIRRLIKDLGQEHTVLLSTHVMQEVEAICEKVIILNQGMIASTGTVAEVTSSKDGLLEIEIGFDGESLTALIEPLRSRFNVNDLGEILIVKIENNQESELYQFLADNTSRQSYITHLVKKQISLEDVFHQLTSE